jgi:O-acetyl-ADP-ribose deacetylase (regulator of RNase III)
MLTGRLMLQFARTVLNPWEHGVELMQSFNLENQIELRILRGDLTQSDADAIVNAANENLQHGAGVAGAIVKQGGMVIQSESNRWVLEHGPISHDQPALTTAGDLPSRAVIHVVGPRWGAGNEDQKLKRAVIAACMLAHDNGFESIAFPAISTGIFGFPMDRAAQVMLDTINEFSAQTSDTSIQRIDLVLFDQAGAQAFSKATREIWS